MTQEQLKRGLELQKNIEDLKNKIEAAKSGLKFPEGTSIKIHFNGYNPYELDVILKKDTIDMFKDHCEKLLKDAEVEFENI